VVLKIKYDVENISHNQSQMDDILTDTVLSIRSRSNFHEDTSANEEDDYNSLIATSS